MSVLKTTLSKIEAEMTTDKKGLWTDLSPFLGCGKYGKQYGINVKHLPSFVNGMIPASFTNEENMLIPVNAFNRDIEDHAKKYKKEFANAPDSVLYQADIFLFRHEGEVYVFKAGAHTRTYRIYSGQVKAPKYWRPVPHPINSRDQAIKIQEFLDSPLAVQTTKEVMNLTLEKNGFKSHSPLTKEIATALNCAVRLEKLEREKPLENSDAVISEYSSTLRSVDSELGGYVTGNKKSKHQIFGDKFNTTGILGGMFFTMHHYPQDALVFWNKFFDENDESNTHINNLRQKALKAKSNVERSDLAFAVNTAFKLFLQNLNNTK